MTLGMTMVFLNTTPKAGSIKEILNQSSPKLQASGLQKDFIKRMRRQVTDWDKLLVKGTCDKEKCFPKYTKKS